MMVEISVCTCLLFWSIVITEQANDNIRISNDNVFPMLKGTQQLIHVREIRISSQTIVNRIKLVEDIVIIKHVWKFLYNHNQLWGAHVSTK